MVPEEVLVTLIARVPSREVEWGGPNTNQRTTGRQGPLPSAARISVTFGRFRDRWDRRANRAVSVGRRCPVPARFHLRGFHVAICPGPVVVSPPARCALAPHPHHLHRVRGARPGRRALPESVGEYASFLGT